MCSFFILFLLEPLWSSSFILFEIDKPVDCYIRTDVGAVGPKMPSLSLQQFRGQVDFFCLFLVWLFLVKGIVQQIFEAGFPFCNKEYLLRFSFPHFPQVALNFRMTFGLETRILKDL